MTTSPAPRRRRFGLAQIHRWLAITLSPVLVLILLSGIALAFRPILGAGQGAPRPRAAVDPKRLAAVIDSLDPRATAMGFFLDDEGAVHLFAPGSGFPVVDVATGRASTSAEAPPAPSFWDYAHRVHVDLWIGAEGLTVLATLAMIFLVVAGPFLSRPRRPRTARGWHVWTGWVAWPLLALLPFSVVMMKIHPPITVSRGEPLPSLARVVERASAAGLDMASLRGAQGLPGGKAIVMAQGARGGRWLLDGTRATSLQSRVAEVGSALHEGTWAGAWSGVLNILAAVASLVMLGSGLLSWARQRRRRRGANEPDLARAA